MQQDVSEKMYSKVLGKKVLLTVEPQIDEEQCES